MNVLRTLLSLSIEDLDQGYESGRLSPNTCTIPFNHQSVQELARPSRLLQRKNGVHGFAHSSVNLNHIRGRHSIMDSNLSRTSQSSDAEEEEEEIHISLDTDPNIPQFNLTLISDCDLSKFNDMTLETPTGDMYPPLQMFASSIHSITSSYSMEAMDPSTSDISLNPVYTMSELKILTQFECKEDDA
eukprot:215277_1